MRGSAGRGLLAAVPRPTLLATYRMNQQTGAAVASGATQAFTSTAGNMSSGAAAIPVNPGELLVFKATSGSSNFYASAISWSGATGTSARWLNQQPASATPLTFWSGVITGTVSITPTITYTAKAAVSSTQIIDVIIERWANAKIDGTCMVAYAALASGTTQSVSGTPGNAQSMISTMLADYTATSPAGNIVYIGGATQNIAPFLGSGVLGSYSSTQPVQSAGVAATMGLASGTVAQQDTVGAIEVKPIAA